MDATLDRTEEKKTPVRKNRVRVLREQSRLTQEELATLTGFSLSTVCKHEARSRGLTDQAIAAYAKVFKVKTYEIFVDPDQLEGRDPDNPTILPKFKSGFPSYSKMGVAS